MRAQKPPGVHNSSSVLQLSSHLRISKALILAILLSPISAGLGLGTEKSGRGEGRPTEQSQQQARVHPDRAGHSTMSDTAKSLSKSRHAMLASRQILYPENSPSCLETLVFWSVNGCSNLSLTGQCVGIRTCHHMPRIGCEQGIYWAFDRRILPREGGT